MAYDLVVGISKFVKDNPVIVGGIEFDEYPHICSLLKRSDNFFLARISNLFEDQSFSVEELNQAQESLGELLVVDLPDSERDILYKLLAVIGYALNKGQMLHGVAD
ncbi:hypothetical protein [Microbulbifer sp. TRSA005]|uniref:hypothetical protein n=1 Tax=Microbulbifer sp. TRSA005 TaxID=3243383 RepID=UPI004039E53B